MINTNGVKKKGVPDPDQRTLPALWVNFFSITKVPVASSFPVVESSITMIQYTLAAAFNSSNLDWKRGFIQPKKNASVSG